MTDPIIQSIESFRCSRGNWSPNAATVRYTLYRAGSGTPIARLRPIGQNDRVEASLVAMEGTLDQRRPFGRTIPPIDDALHFIASADIFWAAG